METTIHYCNILLKGGHEEGEYSKDILYTKEDKTIFTEKRIEGYSKHGSGCVLSAAITAFLNKGYTLTDACREAKQYTLAFLKSSPERIGFHHTISTNAIAD